MNRAQNPNEGRGEIVIYQTSTNAVQLQVRVVGDTVWASLNDLSQLFDTTRQNLTIHIANIYQTAELQEVGTCKDFLQVRNEGAREVRRQVIHYNLDMIISLGYRVNSVVATQFRQWASRILKEYAIKGFALDDARLKEPGSDYFDELLSRIREIRASEKVFYRKVCDIFAESTDYDQHAAAAMEFFQTVQNKLHYAAHGHTAAEVVYQRADARKRDMGLTNYPKSRIRKQDVTIAKNYLDDEEIDVLRLQVSQFLDFAELQARRRKPMRMGDWIERLDLIIQVNGDVVLEGKGIMSKEVATAHAHEEYEKYKAALKAPDAYDELAEAAKRLDPKKP